MSVSRCALIFILGREGVRQSEMGVSGPALGKSMISALTTSQISEEQFELTETVDTVYRGYLGIVKQLLETEGIDVTVADYGYNVLHLASVELCSVMMILMLTR